MISDFGVNNGHFNMSGGSLNVGGFDYTNNGTFSISGGTSTFNGADVINNGTFKITGAAPVFTSTFINNGAYISDPASSYFKDLVVEPTGYLKGGAGNSFFIGGNLTENSTQNISGIL